MNRICRIKGWLAPLLIKNLFPGSKCFPPWECIHVARWWAQSPWSWSRSSCHRNCWTPWQSWQLGRTVLLATLLLEPCKKLEKKIFQKILDFYLIKTRLYDFSWFQDTFRHFPFLKTFICSMLLMWKQSSCTFENFISHVYHLCFTHVFNLSDCWYLLMFEIILLIANHLSVKNIPKQQ